jgi:hypothetical protein
MEENPYQPPENAEPPFPRQRRIVRVRGIGLIFVGIVMAALFGPAIGTNRTRSDPLRAVAVIGAGVAIMGFIIQLKDVIRWTRRYNPP